MNYASGEELSAHAWRRNEVGLWYGGWSAEEFMEAARAQDPIAFLNVSPGQRALGWAISKRFFSIAKAFDGIPNGDWILAAFDASLHLARLTGPVTSARSHPLNRGGELFHYRPIDSKKSFALIELPDSFRLIPGSGRQNTVNQFRKAKGLVALLLDCADAAAVSDRIRAMPFWNWLDLLGPSGWESFCLGYLIIKESYVPSGLTVGGTLPVLDIVGRSLNDESPVIAQCKKEPGPVPVEASFMSAAAALGASGRAYYFAYGGVRGDVPSNIRVIGKTELAAEAELDTRLGRYLGVFRGDPSAGAVLSKGTQIGE